MYLSDCSEQEYLQMEYQKQELRAIHRVKNSVTMRCLVFLQKQLLSFK